MEGVGVLVGVCLAVSSAVDVGVIVAVLVCDGVEVDVYVSDAVFVAENVEVGVREAVGVDVGVTLDIVEVEVGVRRCREFVDSGVPGMRFPSASWPTW